MENPFKIWMNKEDADLVQDIFNRKDDPKFIIVNRFDIPEYPDSVQLELLAEDSFTIWFLAKEVEMTQAFNRRVKEIIDNALKAQQEKMDEINLKLNLLKNKKHE